MASGDEPTEMTAMTADSGASSPDGGTQETTQRNYRNLWYKRMLKSPQGKCIFGVLVCVLLLFVAYLLSKIVIGSIYIDSCPIDPFVPIYMVVSSSLLIAFIILFFIIFVRCRRDKNDTRVSPLLLVSFVYFFLHIVLQLAGSVCVLRTRNEVAELEELQANELKLIPAVTPVTCDANLLAFSFGIVVFELILSCFCLIIAVVSICEVIYLVCCYTPNDEKPQTDQGA